MGSNARINKKPGLNAGLEEGGRGDATAIRRMRLDNAAIGQRALPVGVFAFTGGFDRLFRLLLDR